jgi:ABC-type phosphate/phosphonate transport system substrate-binding protein
VVFPAGCTSKETFYMKKTHVVIFAFIILLLAGAVIVRAEKNSYMFGVYWDAGTKLNTSYGIMAKDLTKAFSQTEKIQMTNVYYKNLDSFHDDIGTRKLDFVYTNTEDDFLHATIYGYKPFATLSIFGKEKASYCLYVRNDSPITSLAGLDGKKLVTYPHMTAYILLRKLLQAPPETTFGEMTTTSDAFASVDALTSGSADAIFLLETNVDYFKQVNPAPVKKIKLLACAEPQYFMPLMVSPDVTEQMMKRMQTFFVGLNTNIVLKKYRPLMKQVRLKVIYVGEADYEPFFNLIESSMAQGWDKDFDTWIASAHELK